MELRSDPQFQGLLSEIEKARPRLEKYDPANPGSIEQMKSASLQQDGFDFAMSFFGVEYD